LLAISFCLLASVQLAVRIGRAFQK